MRNDKQTTTNSKPSEKVGVFEKDFEEIRFYLLQQLKHMHMSYTEKLFRKNLLTYLKRYSNQGKFHSKMAQFQTHEGVSFHEQS